MSTNKGQELKIATKVSYVSIFGNLILSIFKFAAGLLAHSTAMISDAIHSGSDIMSSVVVIAGVRMAAKASDPEHPYGHERLECVAATILASVLLFTGLGIGYRAGESILDGSYHTLTTPGILALVAALCSIISKEAMYWYTRHYAKLIDSSALMADAWHHRSDALSSVGALIGISAARLGYAIMEPVVSLLICLFIVKAAVEIYRDAIDKMTDHSCPPALEEEIRSCVLSVSNVQGIDLLQTRLFGNKIYVDLEIAVQRDLPLYQAHDIAENVHHSIEQSFPTVKHVMVHVNPA